MKKFKFNTKALRNLFVALTLAFTASFVLAIATDVSKFGTYASVLVTLVIVEFAIVQITGKPLLSDGLAYNVNAGVGLARERIVSVFDIKKPEIRNQFYRSRGDQFLPYFEILESLGYSRPIARTWTQTYEEDWIHQTIYIGDSISQNGGTGVLTFTLGNSNPSNSFIEYNSSSPYTASANPNLYAMPVQLNNILRFRNNEQYKVTSISGAGTNAVTITAVANSLSDLITTADYTEGDEIVVSSNAWSEGSGQPNGNNTNVLIGTNYLQRIKAGFSWTGDQETDQLWFNEVVSDDGQKALLGYHILGQENTEYELALYSDEALLFSTLTTNPYIDPLTDEPVQTTEGLFPYIERTGTNYPVLPNTLSINDFVAIEKILVAQRAPKYLGWIMGFDRNQEINLMLKDYNQNTAINYVNKQYVADLFGGNEGLAMSVNFRTFMLTDRFTHCFTVMPQFSHPKLNPAGYKNQWLTGIVPLAKTMDPKTRQMIPYIGMIYKAMNGYNRKYEIWTLSGSGPRTPYVLQEDLSKLCMRRQIGGEHVGGNRMIRLYDPS